MKNLQNYFVTALICIGVCSCNSDEIDLSDAVDASSIELTAAEYASIAFDDPGEISQTDLHAMVESFMSASSENPLTRSLGTSEFKVYSKTDIGKVRFNSNMDVVIG